MTDAERQKRRRQKRAKEQGRALQDGSTPGEGKRG
jgi:hypothetical protein